MDQLEEAKKLTSSFRSEYAVSLKDIVTKSKRLQSACSKIEPSWSGSFTGWQERFNGEWGGINGIPDGWEEKEPEEVKTRIEELVAPERRPWWKLW